jgi:hypothetical protein
VQDLVNSRFLKNGLKVFSCSNKFVPSFDTKIVESSSLLCVMQLSFFTELPLHYWGAVPDVQIGQCMFFL